MSKLPKLTKTKEQEMTFQKLDDMSDEKCAEVDKAEQELLGKISPILVDKIVELKEEKADIAFYAIVKTFAFLEAKNLASMSDDLKYEYMITKYELMAMYTLMDTGMLNADSKQTH